MNEQNTVEILRQNGVYEDSVNRRLQLAELDYFSGSPVEQETIAENFVGYPFEKFK